MIRNDRGDWSYIASFVLAITMLATLALASDIQAIAYGRGRLWSATVVAGQAAVRCLLGTSASPQVPASNCAQTTGQAVFDENMSGDRLAPGPVTVSVSSDTGAPSVSIVASAQVDLPFGLPAGASRQVSLTSQASVALTAAGGP